MADIERLKPEELPDELHRSQSQRYVMFFMESPQHWRADFSRFNNFFNWTMTYRLDSDISIPYGWVLPKSNESKVMSLEQVRHWDNFDYAQFASTLHLKPERF